MVWQSTTAPKKRRKATHTLQGTISSQQGWALPHTVSGRAMQFTNSNSPSYKSIALRETSRQQNSRSVTHPNLPYTQLDNKVTRQMMTTVRGTAQVGTAMVNYPSADRAIATPTTRRAAAKHRRQLASARVNGTGISITTTSHLMEQCCVERATSRQPDSECEQPKEEPRRLFTPDICQPQSLPGRSKNKRRQADLSQLMESAHGLHYTIYR